MKIWAGLVALFISLTVMAAPVDWQEGKHYKIVNPIGKTAEPTVVEVFSYGCPICYRLDPRVAEWLQHKPAKIKFIRVPHYGIHDEGELFIKLFYTAEVLGIGEKIHKPLFDRIHQDSNPPRSEDDAVKFLSGFGVSEKLVRETMNGFAVDSKIRVAKEYVKNLRIGSVPAFVINDKYLTDSAMAGDSLSNVLSELPLK